MSAVQLNERLATGAPLSEAEVTHWISETDGANITGFLGQDAVATKGYIAQIAKNAIEKYLNNSNTEAVSLRCKTQICLVLSNIALVPAMRSVIFDALGGLVGVFEEGMTQEGKMKFDPELGRMTEHVIVLVMRVTDYKLKASGMFEFVEGNFQFAVQLLLAVLLKTPAYELELRCCCLRCLLGFTQPQAFFSPNDKIEETSCDAFTDKVNFTLNLMLRLEAVQVVSDVLAEALISLPADTVSPVVHGAICSMMRCIMNVFQFSSKSSTQWRQHILLSTSFIDGPVSEYMHRQTKRFLSMDSAVALQHSVEVVKGLTLGFKFLSFATFHLGAHARQVRASSLYALSLLKLNVSIVAQQPSTLQLVRALYANLLHFLCNIDALTAGGDFDGPGPQGANPNATTPVFEFHVRDFLNGYAATLGAPQMQELHKAFLAFDSSTLVAQECETFKQISQMFAAALKQAASSSVQAGKSVLGQMPPLQKPQASKKISIESAANTVSSQSKLTVVDQTANAAVLSTSDKELLCALTGNVMKNPVISPYGQTYDKAAIEQWLQQNGSICPITGKPLNLSDLKPNRVVATKIMKEAIQQSMHASAGNNDDDLYDF